MVRLQLYSKIMLGDQIIALCEDMARSNHLFFLLTSDGSRHGGADKIIGVIEVNQSGGGGFEDGLNDVRGHDGLGHHGLAAALHPVDGGGLLVRAEVAGEADHLHVREHVEHPLDRELCRLAQHVHTHRVTRPSNESRSEKVIDCLES